jgi:hypothetical protein
MIAVSGGLEGTSVPFELRRARRSFRYTTPPPNVATVLSIPEGFPWMHFSPRYAQALIVLSTSDFVRGSVARETCSPRINSAVARQTEMEALEPKPEPIGIPDLKKKHISPLMGLYKETKR